MRFPFFKQYDSMDCGPSCLKMIARHYGKNISIEKLRKDCEINKEGVSMLGISNAAEKNGLHSLAVKITFNELIENAGFPCIAHWNQDHFVVLLPKTNANKVIVADPAIGIINYTRDEFLAKWAARKGDGQENQREGYVLLIEPRPAFYEESERQPGSNAYGWNRLFLYLRQHKSNISKIILSMLIVSILQFFFPFLTQSIVDNGINQNDLSFINLILIGQFVLLLSRLIVELIRSRLLQYISVHINASLVSDFWIKLMKLPISYFDSKRAGDIIQRKEDHKRVESFLSGPTLSFFFSIVNLVVFSIILVLYNWFVFFVFATSTALYFFWIFFFFKKRRELDYRIFAASSKENSSTLQLIHGMQDIKINGAEKQKRWEWESVQATLYKLGFKSLSLSQYQRIGAFFINEGKNIFITFFVAKAVLAGTLSLGAMIAIQYIIGQLNGPIEQLISFFQSGQDAKISLERINEIHNLDDEDAEGDGSEFNLPIQHDLVLKNIRFAYPGAGNEDVIKDVTLNIPEGKITAIVGVSGSGKTTLIKLLLKFYGQYDGEITVGETNLKNINSRRWRMECGVVLQDGYIYSDTIARNISLSSESTDYERLIYSCKMANITSFVESLPLRFNTRIGAEGIGISAGQKQRILIARAIYKNPAYLFFDEATNALDANNEKVIVENLNSFFSGKTVVIVAHRLSTVKHADNIVVLKDGRITESGTHEELTNMQSEYYNLVKNQLELGN